MALYTWTSSTSSDSLAEQFSSILLELGLQICEEASSDRQLYAEERFLRGGNNTSNRVNVTVSWYCSSKSKCQVEVRSAEPMFKRDTRCQNFAKALMSHIPPLT